MASPFLGEIRLFPFNVVPRGWIQCNGQILSITQNTALFSLLGVYYGGNGTSTFALPDLRGRVAMDMDTVNQIPPGVISGAENVTLTVQTMPQHNHILRADPTTASCVGAAKNNYLGSAAATSQLVYANPGNQVALDNGTISSTGGNVPHANMQPFLVGQYCIATSGIFPARS